MQCHEEDVAHLRAISRAIALGDVVPYLGPGVFSLSAAPCPIPDSPERLVAELAAKVSVPHRLQSNLTAAAQFIENFKHRKTLARLMQDAFAAAAPLTALHRHLGRLPGKPLLIVNTWYDDAMARALADTHSLWGQLLGLSQTESRGGWVAAYEADGSLTDLEEAETWNTVIYSPLGSVKPNGHCLVSDSDFVEILTEIDIQTPIPEIVQTLRRGRSFLFLGCRFHTQFERIFAAQIMKRSSEQHWAVLSEPPTRNEARFLERHGITPLASPLEAVVATLFQETNREDPVPEKCSALALA